MQFDEMGISEALAIAVLQPINTFTLEDGRSELMRVCDPPRCRETERSINVRARGEVLVGKERSQIRGGGAQGNAAAGEQAYPEE